MNRERTLKPRSKRPASNSLMTAKAPPESGKGETVRRIKRHRTAILDKPSAAILAGQLVLIWCRDRHRGHDGVKLKETNKMRKSLIAIAAAGVLMPAAAIADTQGALVTKWNELNELCRGGLRDDPKADEACERRDVVEALLKKHGCRFVIYTKGPLHEEWICRHKGK